MKLPAFLARYTHASLPPMICHMIFDELCVLANGDIVCSCADPSGFRVYGNVYRDRIGDLYNGPMYQEMRQWQLNAKPDSWCPVVKTVCPGRVSRATTRDGVTGRVVKMLQLEPISYCNLKCPSCPVAHFHTNPAYREDRAAILPLEVMLSVVEQLPDLEKILFYNFGEPFLHKDAIPFLRMVRRQRPDILLHTSTNGLVFTPEKIAALASEALVDLIVFSIDGAREGSYRQYRVHGDLKKALANLRAFVRACARARTAERMEIIWQYILFEWNDSDDELAEARRLAAEIGVMLKWVFTHTEGASLRYTDGSEAATRLYTSEPAARLYGAGDPYNGLTCDMRLKHLWQHQGITAGRYLARLTLDRDVLTGPAGSRGACLLTVENLSPSEWRDEGNRRFRIGVRLRSHTGRILRELHGMPVPPATSRPGGKDTVLLDFALPDAPGRYELFIDVVEDTVCWFSDRSSPPVVCPLKVVEGSAKSWDYRALVERTYRTLLEREPTGEEWAHWQGVLQSGALLEWMLADVGKAGMKPQSRRFEKRLKQLRRELLAEIDALRATGESPYERVH
jgi:organic radical activating enzyme